MENFNPLDDQATGHFKLNSISIEYMRETAKWARFLSIVGFVMVGLIVLGGVFAGTFMGSMMAAAGSPIGGVGIALLYIGMAALYFFPTLYLFRYSKNTKQAIETNSEDLLTEGVGNMKSVFKFWGIFMAIILAFYAVILVFSIVGGGLAALLS